MSSLAEAEDRSLLRDSKAAKSHSGNCSKPHTGTDFVHTMPRAIRRAKVVQF